MFELLIFIQSGASEPVTTYHDAKSTNFLDSHNIPIILSFYHYDFYYLFVIVIKKMIKLAT